MARAKKSQVSVSKIGKAPGPKLKAKGNLPSFQKPAVHGQIKTDALKVLAESTTSNIMKMDNPRQRLRPWLEAMIDKGQIPGLRWLSDNKTLFKIPWKHGGKQDWTPDNSRIFLEWARHTGRYREGIDKPDYATWKTRLRCAFNKAPDIQEVPDETCLNTQEPYRVYRLLPKKDSKRHTHSPPLSDSDGEMGHSPRAKHAPLGMGPVPLFVEEMSAASGKVAEYPSGMESLPSDLKNLPSGDLLGKFQSPTTAIPMEMTQTVPVPSHEEVVYAQSEENQMAVQDIIQETEVEMEEIGKKKKVPTATLR